MQVKMKPYVALLLLAAFCQASIADPAAASPPQVPYADVPADVERLRTALASVKMAPSNLDAERAYLVALPRSYARFVAIFSPRTPRPYELSAEYIDVLLQIGDQLPAETFGAVFRIEHSATWDADEVNSLQHSTIELAKRHPSEFGQELERLTPQQRGGVLKFLLDGPVPAKQAAFVGPIGAKLRESGYVGLASELHALAEATARKPAWR
jgi:hypothetical protein